MIDLEDGTYTAVVDSIEDGLGTIFSEDDGEDVASEVRDASDLPEPGWHAHALFSVEINDNDIVEWTYEQGKMERQEAVYDRFDRLSSRTPDDDDGE